MSNFESQQSLSLEAFNSLVRVDKVVWNSNDFACVVNPPPPTTPVPTSTVVTTTTTIPPTTATTLAPTTTSTIPPTTTSTPPPTTSVTTTPPPTFTDPTIVISGPTSLAPFTREIVTVTVTNPSNYNINLTPAITNQSNYLNPDNWGMLEEAFSITGSKGTYKMALAFDLFTDAESSYLDFPTGSLNNITYVNGSGTYSFYLYNDGATPTEFEFSFACQFYDHDNTYKNIDTNHLTIRYVFSQPSIVDVSPLTVKYGDEVEFEISNFPLTLGRTKSPSSSEIIQTFKNNFSPTQPNNLHPVAPGDYWINPFVKNLAFYFNREETGSFWKVVTDTITRVTSSTPEQTCYKTHCEVVSAEQDLDSFDFVSDFDTSISPLVFPLHRFSELVSLQGYGNTVASWGAFDAGSAHNFLNYVKIIDHKTVRLKFPTVGFPAPNLPCGAYDGYHHTKKQYMFMTMRCKININVFGVMSSSTNVIIDLKGTHYHYSNCCGFEPEFWCEPNY